MKNLIKTDNLIQEPKENQDINKKIINLKRKLINLTEKYEQLKNDLIIVKQEYEIRIGRLYLKIGEVDRFKKISNETDALNKIVNNLAQSINDSGVNKISVEQQDFRIN